MLRSTPHRLSRMTIHLDGHGGGGVVAVSRSASAAKAAGNNPAPVTEETAGSCARRRSIALGRGWRGWLLGEDGVVGSWERMAWLAAFKRQHVDVSPACHGLTMNSPRRVRGIELRDILTMHLFQHGPTTIADLVEALAVRHPGPNPQTRAGDERTSGKLSLEGRHSDKSPEPPLRALGRDKGDSRPAGHLFRGLPRAHGRPR